MTGSMKLRPDKPPILYLDHSNLEMNASVFLSDVKKNPVLEKKMKSSCILCRGHVRPCKKHGVYEQKDTSLLGSRDVDRSGNVLT